MKALLVLVLSLSTAHAEISAADQAKVTEFVKSLSYLFYKQTFVSSPNPAVVPNVWGCAINWDVVDECMDREKLKLNPINFCPPRVYAGFDSKGCDLQAEKPYTLPDKKPLDMALQVRNSALVKRVAFQFRFATAPVRKPVPENAGSKTSLPWWIEKNSGAFKLAKGKVYGEGEELLADFELDYAMEGLSGRYANKGGKLKITFPKKSPVEQAFIFPFEKK